MKRLENSCGGSRRTNGGVNPSSRRLVPERQQHLRSLQQGMVRIVLPPLSYENQPFSILEAFACGKPAIASELAGMTQLLVHQERGLLVSSGDVGSLARAMIHMMEHPVGCICQLKREPFDTRKGNHFSPLACTLTTEKGTI
jgi:glycosyltransferase involved in cell wall biosynthesis